MAWESIGSAVCTPNTIAVRVGGVRIPSSGGIVLRVAQVGGSYPWPFSYGLAYVLNERGRELGTIKVYGVPEGDHYRLGPYLPSSVGSGDLYFEPRSWSRAWIKQTNRAWVLSFSYDTPALVPGPDRYNPPGFATADGSPLGVESVGTDGRLRF